MTFPVFLRFIAGAFLMVQSPLVQAQTVIKDAAADLTGGQPATTDRSASSYSVPGIKVDVLARSADEAREAAFRLAQRQAWPKLWARTTGGAASAAPGLSDADLFGLVIGIDVEAEQVSDKRYIGQLTVVFDPGKVRKMLGTGDDLGGPVVAVLVLPALHDGGRLTGYDPDSIWYAAWARFNGSGGNVDYIVPEPDPGDMLVLTGYRAGRQHLSLLRQALMRFGALDVLAAEAKLTRLYPGGPVKGQFTAFRGLDRQPLVRFSLDARGPGDLPAMLDRAVLRMERALAAEIVRSSSRTTLALSPVIGAQTRSPQDDLQANRIGAGVQVLVETPDVASVSAARARLLAVPTVRSVTIVQLNLGGRSGFVLDGSEGFDWVRYSLHKAGLTMLPSDGGRWVLRARTPDDPEIERPLTDEEIAAKKRAEEEAAQAEQADL